MFGVGSPSNITEVRRFAAVLFDQVEGCHDKSCAISYDANVAVQFDEGETVFPSLRLQSRDLTTDLFRSLLELWMSEKTVVVNYDSEVCGNEAAILRLDNGIALHEFRIIDYRQSIKIGEKVGEGALLGALVSELQRDEPGVVASHSEDGVETMSEHLLGGLAGDIFNVDTTLVGGEDGLASVRSI